MNHTNERGQVMILVVLGIIALVSAAGLALDGGRLYQQRRQVQNAADAAAMAGAQKLLQKRTDKCESQPSLSAAAIDQEVRAAIVDFADKNGVTHADPSGNIEAWYVEAAEDGDPADVQVVGALTDEGQLERITGIRITLTLTESTTFMKVVGQNTMVNESKATAMFGPVTSVGGGILPIGVPLEVVEALDPGERFHILETNNHNGGSFCTDPDNEDTCVGDPASHNAHRGWLNLNYIYNLEHLDADDPYYRTFEQNVPNRPCGSEADLSTDDGLQGWATTDCPYPYPIFAGNPPDGDGTRYVNGDFIHGMPGARDKSAQNVDSYHSGQIAYAPIFDYIYMSDYMDEHFDTPEDIGWPRAGGGGHAFLYHIVGFVGMEIIDYEKGGGTKALVGEFESAILGESGITPGFGPATGNGDPCAATVYGVVLWE